ncbi:glycoside hydrolase family 99-like domain-containing protein [Anthocerotibacter panamensis]|uniref:glycoside hydrolase family 99-like domain-containing protein n=1 Tax=Anthocerotibacter panamensis TaxID=2857077 RepID=UPI001C406928|nr:glycoside hydrolase family 99-like domain-containing protein [Anthocerotibacter panamensis]
MSNLSHEVRLIAFYLPQYHPIPENDNWWGKGFTEWTNVTKAKPLFPGHYQPHLPSDLGFYDLRLPEVRQAQADLAKAHGIYGFCYYHYWFHGNQLLEKPFDEVLLSGQPDFPFCLCWPNENWTRTWDGLDREILIEQKYSEEDDRAHIHWLAKAFADKRYIRVDGKPLFIIYRASKLPNPFKTTLVWREEAQKLGIGDLFLCCVQRTLMDRSDPVEIGFDAAMEFQPDLLYLGPPLAPIHQSKLWRFGPSLDLVNPAYVQNSIYDYSSLIQIALSKPEPSYTYFPCVMPAWDNSARRNKQALIFTGSRPELYEFWLRTVIQRINKNPSKPGLVFINAWNEWAEGNHLEPCQRWGSSYLEATLKALKSDTSVIEENLLCYQIKEIFRLREINLITFPDWNQSDEILYKQLERLVLWISNHPNRAKMTLILAAKDFPAERISAMLTSVVSYLVLEKGFEVSSQVEISLASNLSPLHWQVLLAQLQQWIRLKTEDTHTAFDLGVHRLLN